MRRIYDAISQTLGYRTLQQFSGGDVWQLKVMLQALGLFAADQGPLDARAAGANNYTPDVVAAVDAFARRKLGRQRSARPPGWSIRKWLRTFGQHSNARERHRRFANNSST